MLHPPQNGAWKAGKFTGMGQNFPACKKSVQHSSTGQLRYVKLAQDSCGGHVDISGDRLVGSGSCHGPEAQHRHCNSYSEHPWTRYLPRFTMHSRTSSIMLRIYYPPYLAACGSQNPGSKSTVGCVRTRSYTFLERELNRFISQDRKGLGRRWILLRIPCARRSQWGERVLLLLRLLQRRSH